MRVLFIGNSHTYFNDMPETFAKMCRKLSGKRPEVTMLAYSGKSLKWHTEEYFSLRYALMYGKFEYCVIQQQAHPFPDPEETYTYVKRITDLCFSNKVTPVLFMTWAKKDEPDAFYEMKEVYRDLTEETGSLLAPVGNAFDIVNREYPKIDLYWKDGAHASAYGSYLSALIFAMIVTGKHELAYLSDEGIDFRCDFEGDHGFPKAEEKKFLAKVPLDPAKTEILKKVAGRVLGIREKELPENL